MQCPLAPWTPPGIPPHPLISTTKQKERETSKHSEPRESRASHRPKISGGCTSQGHVHRVRTAALTRLIRCRLPCLALLHHLFDRHYIGSSVGPLFAIPEPL